MNSDDLNTTYNLFITLSNLNILNNSWSFLEIAQRMIETLETESKD